MNRNRLALVITCGLLTGFVFYVLTTMTLAAFAQRALSVLSTVPSYPKLSGGFFVAVDIFMGIWVMWLYSVATVRYGSGARTAIVCGFAWWAMKTLQSANWVGLGFVPVDFVPVPLVTSFACAITASVIGATCFTAVERHQSESHANAGAG